jgi:hypothetical protein
MAGGELNALLVEPLQTDILPNEVSISQYWLL